MKLYDYQVAARRTAEPRAFHLEYLVPGIVGETGELIGHMAKGFWHEIDVQDKMMLEYGDICWQTALLLHVEGVHDVAPLAEKVPTDPRVVLVQSAGYMYQFYCDASTRQYVKSEAVHLWRLLEASCLTITGHSFESVLQANLDKLASRAERGVLKGSGDHR